MDRFLVFSMRLERWLIGLFILALCAAPGLSESDQFTPVVASALTASTQVFPGTDGSRHVVYELVLTNASPTPATLQKIEVLDASHPSKVLAAYDGQELLSRLRMTANPAAGSAEIPFNGTRIFLIDFALASGTPTPRRLVHRMKLLGAPGPGGKAVAPVLLSYTAAPIDLVPELSEIGPPLAGKGWVVINGCCEPGGAHRSTGLAVNGRIYFAQRFAIDWMQLDSEGRMVHGDPSDVHNYTDYGVNVLAVADGTVVETLNTLDDQKPGTLPDPKTINISNVDGNHVILDLGNGMFAFYAHLQKDSVTVSRGDHVKRGQVLGKLGNTGNTSAPHLHFHLMDGPSALGSSGLPYGIDSFVVAGQVPAAKFAAATDLEGNWSEGALHAASPRHAEFPMDLTIVDFSSNGESESHSTKSAGKVVRLKH